MQPHRSLSDCWSSLDHLESVGLEEVVGMHTCKTMTGVSTQEETDTLMIHHALEVATNWMNVQNTRMLLILALRTTPLIGDRSAATIAQPKHDAKVLPQPIIIMTNLARRNQDL